MGHNLRPKKSKIMQQKCSVFLNELIQLLNVQPLWFYCVRGLGSNPGQVKNCVFSRDTLNILCSFIKKLYTCRRSKVLPTKKYFYFCSFVSAPSFFLLQCHKNLARRWQHWPMGEKYLHISPGKHRQRDREKHICLRPTQGERAQDSTFALQVQIELLPASLFFSSFPC